MALSIFQAAQDIPQVKIVHVHLFLRIFHENFPQSLIPLPISLMQSLMSFQVSENGRQISHVPGLNPPTTSAKGYIE